jgi:hypothetical protein
VASLVAALAPPSVAVASPAATVAVAALPVVAWGAEVGAPVTAGAEGI